MRQRERRLGALVALFGALLQAHLAGRDDGDLRHGENAVGQDEQEDDEEFGADSAIVPFDSRQSPVSLRRPFDLENPPFDGAC